jgi:hypothetical protein
VSAGELVAELDVEADAESDGDAESVVLAVDDALPVMAARAKTVPPTVPA